MTVPMTMGVSGLGEHARGFRAQTLLSLVRLKWFIHLRWVMLACCIVALWADWMFSRPARRPVQLFAVIAGLIIVNIAWANFSSLLRRRVSEGVMGQVNSVRGASILANAQIAVDLFALTLLLRYSGGVENPMAIFYLFHVAIAALLLTSRVVLIHAFWAIVLYTSIAIGELVDILTPHYPFLPMLPTVGLFREPAFVFCVVFVTATGIFGMLYFMSKIVAFVASHERRTARAIFALRDSQRVMAALQHRKALFMRTAAHQLKTPLAAIQTQVSLLRDGLVPTGELRSLYDRIIARCREGITQVTDLLIFARLQDLDNDRHRVARTDIASVIYGICERYAFVARESGINIVCENAPMRKHFVSVHTADLTDCLTNLVDNAVKYTSSGGTVTISLEEHEFSVTVRVIDSGMGISKETRLHLFEPYRRGTEAILADIPGSGLGMSIVQAVVEQASGRITLDSEPGRGTCVAVTFPLTRDGGSAPKHIAEKGT